MSTFKTDVDFVAHSYVRDNVNLNVNPFHANWQPSYVNGALLDAFDANPPQTTPSISTLAPFTTMQAVGIGESVVSIGAYYGRICRGHYGLWTTDANGNRYQGEGNARFFFNGSAPGVPDHANNVANAINNLGSPGGTILYAHLTNWYQACWNVIVANLDTLTVDLTICHSSCHTSCHGARGRR